MSELKGVTAVSEGGAPFFVPCTPGLTSDGYHTFDELYEHRCLLSLAFLNLHGGWKARKHADGSVWEGWFIAGTAIAQGEGEYLQITYHLPDRMWDLCNTVHHEFAPEWDGHTSQDVLERLTKWLTVASR